MNNLKRAIEWLQQTADPNDEGDHIALALAAVLEVWAVHDGYLSAVGFAKLLDDYVRPQR